MATTHNPINASEEFFEKLFEKFFWKAVLKKPRFWCERMRLKKWSRIRIRISVESLYTNQKISFRGPGHFFLVFFKQSIIRYKNPVLCIHFVSRQILHCSSFLFFFCAFYLSFKQPASCQTTFSHCACKLRKRIIASATQSNVIKYEMQDNTNYDDRNANKINVCAVWRNVHTTPSGTHYSVDWALCIFLNGRIEKKTCFVCEMLDWAIYWYPF